MDWSTGRMESIDCDEDEKSISSESSGGGMQDISPNVQQQHFREYMEIWNPCEIGLSLRTLPNADKAQEMLDLNVIDGNFFTVFLHACSK